MKKEQKKEEKKVKVKEVKEKKVRLKKPKTKRDWVLISLYAILAILVIFFVVYKIINWNVLSPSNKRVVELHDYFSTENLDYCDGLFNYGDEKITYDKLENLSRLCIAYHKSDVSGEEKLTYDAGEKESTCNVDGMIFKTDKDSTECTVTKIKRETIDDTYKKIFGHEVEDEESFKFDGYSICYMKDDAYYCGSSEYFTIILNRDISIYRAVAKAYKEKDTITIYDYFARISNNECYQSNTNGASNVLCNAHLNSFESDSYNALKKYGTTFKSVYKKAKDGTYYWVSTEPYAEPGEKKEL